MKKVFLTMAAVVALISASFAQTGKNQLGIGAELGVSAGEGGGVSYGGSAKYLHGIGTAGQLTFTAGALFDSDSDGDFKQTGRQIPLLAGYRHNFNGLYVEPQFGYLSTSVTLKEEGEKVLTVSDGAFAYAIGGGYAFTNGLDLGVSFRNGAKSGYTGLFVFRAAFNLNLSGAGK